MSPPDDDDALGGAHQVQAMEFLVAELTHELNNPLCFLLATLELAHRRAAELVGGSTPPEVQQDLQECLQDALQGVSRIRGIVDDLGKRFDPQPTLIGSCDLHAALEWSAKAARPALDHHRASLRLDLGQIDRAAIDEGRLSQVLTNLLVNAAAAVSEETLVRRTIELKAARARGGVELLVIDHGTGMTPEVTDRIFEPYYTTKRSGQGLGLFLCRALLDSAGGSIEVESVLGEGTTFTIWLPAAPGPRSC